MPEDLCKQWMYVFSFYAIAMILISIPPSYEQNNSGQKNVFNDNLGWYDQFNQCMKFFACSEDTTTGWNDNKSMLFSTSLNIPLWSGILGPEIINSAGKNYSVVSHIKLNSKAVQSHIVVEGFNRTSEEWYQIWHCPSGMDGPIEWREFKCEISVPEDTNKIRLKLNAGWSSSGAPNQYASTWYDDLSVVTINQSSIK